MFATPNIPQPVATIDEIMSNGPSFPNPAEAPTAFQNLSIIKKLNNNKFPVNLVFSPANQQYYVMKVYPYIGRHIHPNFTNEARFSTLNHPNVVDFVHTETKDDTIRKAEGKPVSYILMEYAPHGDFCSFISNYGEKMDEKLVRTYFRQLIEGLDYLHKNGIAHLDLKPDNLLIGADFNLKIVDFDLSYMRGDAKTVSNGTKCFRAPELFRPKTYGNPIKASFAADIFSAAMLLFIMKSRGIYPHTEETIYKGLNLLDLMYNDNDMFWEKHYKMARKDSDFYAFSFKELFNNMVKEDPNERIKIDQIRESDWYNAEIYTPSELTNKMKELLNC